MEDADACATQSAHECARAIYSHALSIYPKKKSVRPSCMRNRFIQIVLNEICSNTPRAKMMAYLFCLLMLTYSQSTITKASIP